MLRFLRPDDDAGLEIAEERFVGMLHDARHVLDLALGARLGGTDPVVVEDDLVRTEERTDEAEREIRRRVLVHASAHGARADIGSCLRYMSIAKDAERIADLARQLFGIAQVAGAEPAGWARDDLGELGERLSPLIVEVAEVFRAGDPDRAGDVITEARELQVRCRGRIDALLRQEEDVPNPVAVALTYRQLSRIAANVLNIASAVVMPLDEMDYPGRE